MSSNPLAGTTPRTGDPVIDARLAAELRASEKNQIEHRVVIDMVHDTLLPWCSYLDWQPEPEVVAVANVQHLGTRIEGKLSMPLPHVVQLMQTLSPTPALGGHPRAAALALLAQHEGLARGRYGGSVGWCDRHGNGTWAVTIRCAIASPDSPSNECQPNNTPSDPSVATVSSHATASRNPGALNSGIRAATPRPAKPTPSRTKSTPSLPAMSLRSTLASVKSRNGRVMRRIAMPTVTACQAAVG
ncbi:MAG: hypothetical protein EBW96_01485 [Actinobacteria bacterium]|nr:hypothetical protein [Actinomycetota bacterium]